MTDSEAKLFFLAKRIYCDYKTSKGILKTLEPESFVEKWLIKNNEKVTTEVENSIWRHFLMNLRYGSK